MKYTAVKDIQKNGEVVAKAGDDFDPTGWSEVQIKRLIRLKAIKETGGSKVSASTKEASNGS